MPKASFNESSKNYDFVPPRGEGGLLELKCEQNVGQEEK